MDWKTVEEQIVSENEVSNGKETHNTMNRWQYDIPFMHDMISGTTSPGQPNIARKSGMTLTPKPGA